MKLNRTAVCLVVAHLASGCADEADAEHCSVEERDDGTVHIVCPDSSVVLEPCYASLPDLDGNGDLNEADCALVGAGAIQRELCDSAEAWKQLDACRATSASELDIHPVNYTVGAMQLLNEQFTVAYMSEAGLELWRDVDGDLAADDGEVSMVFAGSLHSPSMETDSAGCLSITAQSFQGSTRVPYWHDTNCNQLAEAGEVALLEFGPPAGALSSQRLVPWGNSLAIVYFGPLEDATSQVDSLRAWTDLDADYQVDAAEVIEIASSGILDYFGATIYESTASQRIAYLRYSQDWSTAGADVVWTFGNQWSLASGTSRQPYGWEATCHEIHSIEASSNYVICKNSDGTIGLALTGRDSLIPIPDGYGSQVVSSALSTRAWTRYLVLRASDYVLLWVDENNDWTPAAHEMIRRDGAFGAAVVDGSPLFLRRNGEGQSVVERWGQRDQTLFLGEVCVQGFLQCAGHLECRISGRSPDYRCVPPTP